MSLAERTRAALAGLTGAVRPVLTAPDRTLNQPGKPVDPAGVATLVLAADLIATMRESPSCVGLAAPQLGIGLRVFVVDVTGHPKATACHGCFVLCNAEIVEASRWKAGREGCMSVRHLTGDVKRAGRITVTGQLPGSGEDVSLATEGFEARAVQHEVDHCAGRLFLDRVAGAHAIHPRQVYL